MHSGEVQRAPLAGPQPFAPVPEWGKHSQVADVTLDVRALEADAEVPPQPRGEADEVLREGPKPLPLAERGVLPPAPAVLGHLPQAVEEVAEPPSRGSQDVATILQTALHCRPGRDWPEAGEGCAASVGILPHDGERPALVDEGALSGLVLGHGVGYVDLRSLCQKSNLEQDFEALLDGLRLLRLERLADHLRRERASEHEEPSENGPRYPRQPREDEGQRRGERARPLVLWVLIDVVQRRGEASLRPRRLREAVGVEVESPEDLLLVRLHVRAVEALREPVDVSDRVGGFVVFLPELRAPYREPAEHTEAQSISSSERDQVAESLRELFLFLLFRRRFRLWTRAGDHHAFANLFREGSQLLDDHILRELQPLRNVSNRDDEDAPTRRLIRSLLVLLLLLLLLSPDLSLVVLPLSLLRLPLRLLRGRGGAVHRQRCQWRRQQFFEPRRRDVVEEDHSTPTMVNPAEGFEQLGLRLLKCLVRAEVVLREEARGLRVPDLLHDLAAPVDRIRVEEGLQIARESRHGRREGVLDVVSRSEPRNEVRQCPADELRVVALSDSSRPCDDEHVRLDLRLGRPPLPLQRLPVRLPCLSKIRLRRLNLPEPECCPGLQSPQWQSALLTLLILIGNDLRLWQLLHRGEDFSCVHQRASSNFPIVHETVHLDERGHVNLVDCQVEEVGEKPNLAFDNLLASIG
mmetsp:Transcript_8632/g.21232  ORF Transcript_8632/g.21232 Transcript_8632/m.21232 type:complete len:693 (+) Transcript_8632:1446-3524(+)